MDAPVVSPDEQVIEPHEVLSDGLLDDDAAVIEADAPLDPVNLAFDKAGNLLVLSSLGAEGTLYTFKPGTPSALKVARASRWASASASMLVSTPSGRIPRNR